MSNTNTGVKATFIDRYGEEREIHATRNGLRIKRQTTTVALKLNRPIALYIGTRIRQERIKAGLTLQELCLRAGLSTSSTPKARMWEIENALRKEGLRFGTLYAIASALGVEASALLPPVADMLCAAELATQQPSRLMAVTS